MTKSKDREFLEFLHARMLWKIVNKNEFKNWLKKADGGLSWEEVLKDFTSSSVTNDLLPIQFQRSNSHPLPTI